MSCDSITAVLGARAWVVGGLGLGLGLAGSLAGSSEAQVSPPNVELRSGVDGLFLTASSIGETTIAILDEGKAYEVRIAGRTEVAIGDGCRAVPTDPAFNTTLMHCTRTVPKVTAALRQAQRVRFSVAPDFPDPLVVYGGMHLMNRVRGGAGDDLIVGGRDADDLDGRGGRDRIVGGGGIDLIQARDGAPDAIDCGSSRRPWELYDFDRALLDTSDPVRPKRCESVQRWNIQDRPPVRLVFGASDVIGTKVPIVLACPRTARSRCRGHATLRLARGGARHPRRTRFSITPGRRQKIRLVLTRREARRIPPLRARVHMSDLLTVEPSRLGARRSQRRVPLSRL